MGWKDQSDTRSHFILGDAIEVSLMLCASKYANYLAKKLLLMIINHAHAFALRNVSQNFKSAKKFTRALLTFSQKKNVSYFFVIITRTGNTQDAADFQ